MSSGYRLLSTSWPGSIMMLQKRSPKSFSPILCTAKCRKDMCRRRPLHRHGPDRGRTVSHHLFHIQIHRRDGISSSFSYTNPQARHSFSVLGPWMQKKDGSMHDDKRIPAFTNYEDMAEFWDTQSLANYWDQPEPADFEITPEARRRYLVAVDREVLARVQRLARMRGVSSESLVNLLLEQRLRE